MKPLLNLIILVTLVAGCTHSESVYFPATRHINKSEHAAIQKKFDLRSVYAAQDFLGGLAPNYPIAFALGDIIKEKHPDMEWVNGGFLPLLYKIVIKKDDGYVLINNKEELKKVYAPITSNEEAISYTILSTRSFAVFDKGYFKSAYKYYGEKPGISFARQKDGYYLVHLFQYQAFGCSHPYSSCLFKVTTGGDVTILETKKSFEDPADNGLCVD